MVRVTSTMIHSVTCGAVNADPTIAAAVILRTPLIGTRVSPRASARDGIPEAYAAAVTVSSGAPPWM
ncbi:MAG: hypothetical protein BWY91_02809 [bacterium ADurb.BinA028]|nr:MAG: hypothetical protein BWY91_02809 [bacterium ADurb.BinA028]